MRVLSESGGVTTTVVGDSMQRAPAFVLPDALGAREFGVWVDAHLDQIRSAAEATTRAGRLTHITCTPSAPSASFAATTPRVMLRVRT